MNCGQEILRAFLLAFGITEIITNTVYLLKENGLDLARNQHRELPENISYKKIKLKVVIMLLFGIVFFITSLSTYVLHRYISNMIFITLILFSIYGIIEFLYYRYWKTFGFAIVTILLMLASELV